jgi:RNA polymerase sigma factor (sigma-70 family)
MPEARPAEFGEPEGPLLCLSPSDIATYLPAALRFARRLLPWDAAEADDVAQDVMLAFVKKSPTIPTDQVLGWLYGATRLAVAERKRRYSRKEGGLTRLRHALLGPTAAPSHREPNDLLLDLRRALPRLTDKQKEVLHLWALGNDYDEIAHNRHIEVNTVKDHLKKAFSTIRSILASDTKGGGHA